MERVNVVVMILKCSRCASKLVVCVFFGARSKDFPFVDFPGARMCLYIYLLGFSRSIVHF